MAKKILIVDDDFNQRDLYLELFDEAGYETFFASDGLEGLEIALDKKPDLVFTGIEMPRMDGFELIRNLRKNMVTAQVPVILFSHLGREEDHQKASSFPKVEFMLKGSDGPPVILKKIKELIGEAGEKSLRPKQEPQSSRPVPVNKIIPNTEKPITPKRPIQKPAPKSASPKRPKGAGRDRGGEGMIIV